MASSPTHQQSSRHPSMTYPTLVGAAALIAGVLMLIETFFYFGHQSSATATGAMVLGAMLVVSPTWALIASHLAHSRTRVERVVDHDAPIPTNGRASQITLGEQVAEEVRRQLSAGFSSLARGERNDVSQPQTFAAPAEPARTNASTSVSA